MTERAVTQTWLVLVAITVGSWWLAPAQYSATLAASVPITVLVLALTLVKARLIIRQFMEVRTAPRWLKLATDGWLVVLFGAVLTIYLI
ncbi:prokaryotic cytochrome C oxidase subunit IV family protein [Mycobacterium sp. NS-7484]|uniref:cytochrome C oxidase subunit IV family protein n=1 Tax=unclassified Mycobacterium TaxID=2642494 RepID=UPI0007FF3C10|nr:MULTISPECIES: cytochrome C oxidase subunit IV family protein [unclassified Mycobacterium]OBG85984.1 prokaryotic cytochrome C oxidase subunit IV family protein [Mycobacterium sp. E802]OMB94022.1 prokaryotic cytochrome C oxidase subunit IV family protein [Mycobacterium sp. NS-7484]